MASATTSPNDSAHAGGEGLERGPSRRTASGSDPAHEVHAVAGARACVTDRLPVEGGTHRSSPTTSPPVRRVGPSRPSAGPAHRGPWPARAVRGRRDPARGSSPSTVGPRARRRPGSSWERGVRDPREHGIGEDTTTASARPRPDPRAPRRRVTERARRWWRCTTRRRPPGGREGRHKPWHHSRPRRWERSHSRSLAQVVTPAVGADRNCFGSDRLPPRRAPRSARRGRRR